MVFKQVLSDPRVVSRIGGVGEVHGKEARLFDAACAPADVVKTRRIYSGKMRLQYSTYCVAYGFVVAAVAHVETKVKGSFFSSLSSFLSLS